MVAAAVASGDDDAPDRGIAAVTSDEDEGVPAVAAAPVEESLDKEDSESVTMEMEAEAGQPAPPRRLQPAPRRRR